jgi:phospholipase/lecithinase/hemolysin
MEGGDGQGDILALQGQQMCLEEVSRQAIQIGGVSMSADYAVGIRKICVALEPCSGISQTQVEHQWQAFLAAGMKASMHVRVI